MWCYWATLAFLSRVVSFPTVPEGSTLSQHRRTSSSGVSAGRPRGAANGGALTGRHGGARQAEKQPSAWTEHPGEVPGQLQVSSRGFGAPVTGGGGARSADPWRLWMRRAALRGCGRWCSLLWAAAAAFGSDRLCGFKSQCVVVWHVLCLGVSVLRGTKASWVCVRVCVWFIQKRHSFLMWHTFW